MGFGRYGGDVLTQPLFVQGAIDGRDVVYVATLDNYVDAIDAPDGRVQPGVA